MNNSWKIHGLWQDPRPSVLTCFVSGVKNPSNGILRRLSIFILIYSLWAYHVDYFYYDNSFRWIPYFFPHDPTVRERKPLNHNYKSYPIGLFHRGYYYIHVSGLPSLFCYKYGYRPPSYEERRPSGIWQKRRDIRRIHQSRIVKNIGITEGLKIEIGSRKDRDQVT